MQSQAPERKITISSLYFAIFKNELQIEIKHLAEKKGEKTNAKNFTEEEISSKIHAGNDKKIKQKKQEYICILNDKNLSASFRCLLREFKATALENLLYGNDTDLLPSPANIMPTDESITRLFLDLDKEYYIFQNNQKEATKEFIEFFKFCKIIADYFEKNNDAKNHVAAEHAYKMLVYFGYNKKGNPFANVQTYFKTHQCYKQLNPVHDTFAANQLPRAKED